MELHHCCFLLIWETIRTLIKISLWHSFQVKSMYRWTDRQMDKPDLQCSLPQLLLLHNNSVFM